MLHTLEKGEYPKGHRYWSNATGDLNAALEDLPVQLRRVLDELWSDGYGVECYLVEWNGRYCVQLSAMYDESYAADLGMGYPELVELARGRAEELGAERPDLPSHSMDSLRGILGIERRDAHRALADCYDELAVLNAELSVIMQSYARKMDYCRGELLRIAGEITEEIGE